MEEIFDAHPGTIAGNELESIGNLIEKYEEKHYPIEAPHKIEAIKFRMEQMVNE